MVGEVGRSEDIIVGNCGTMYAEGRLIDITVGTIGYMIVDGIMRRILVGYIGHEGAERLIQLVGGVRASKFGSLLSAPLMRNSMFGDCLVLFKDWIAGGVCASKSGSLSSAPLMKHSMFGDCLGLFKDWIASSSSSPNIIGNALLLVEKPISG